MKRYYIIFGLICILALAAMQPAGRYGDIRLERPEGWPEPYDIFAGNPPTKAGFLLGRKLFYDGRLSKDGNFPCASCHEPRAAFATMDHDLSHGFGDQFTTRNAPALQNLAWQLHFNWDGQFDNLAHQATFPITAPNEMAEDMDSVVLKLSRDKEYRRMFSDAFGKGQITAEKLLHALAQFTGMMVSADAKYDRVMRGVDSFNSAEEKGYTVFKTHCATCHKEPLFTDNTFRNNGLDTDPYLNDYGRMMVTGKPEDSIRFRVPSLRNVGVTQPYMHDGRFYSLNAVLEHYESGIQQGPTLDPLLSDPIKLTPREKHDLTYFLHTLTDSAFMTNPAFIDDKAVIPRVHTGH